MGLTARNPWKEECTDILSACVAGVNHYMKGFRCPRLSDNRKKVRFIVEGEEWVLTLKNAKETPAYPTRSQLLDATRQAAQALDNVLLAYADPRECLAEEYEQWQSVLRTLCKMTGYESQMEHFWVIRLEGGEGSASATDGQPTSTRGRE
jgi:hypothetical protein